MINCEEQDPCSFETQADPLTEIQAGVDIYATN